MRFLMMITCLALTACGTTPIRQDELKSPSPGRGPSLVVVTTANPETARASALFARVGSFTNNGTVERMSVELTKKGLIGRGEQLITLPDADIARLDQALSAGPAANKAVIEKAAIQVARRTFCRTGPVALNRNIRQYSAAEFPVTGGPILGSRVPKGAKGQAVPPITYHAFGNGYVYWEVQLNCAARNPYLN